MRIIKAAKRTEEYVTVCSNCRSILGLTVGDLSNESSGFSFYCAVCGCRNHIKAEYKDTLFPWMMEEEEDETKNETTPHLEMIKKL